MAAISGWRKSALSSKLILASRAIGSPPAVISIGLISSSEASVPSNAR